MGKRGPRPKPTAIRLLESRGGQLAGHRPLNANEPELPTLVEPDDLPTELQRDTVASAEWRRLMPLLQRARVITEGDRSLLIALCQQWSRYQEANERAETMGLVVTMPTSGYPMPNPFLGVANKALSHCTKLWAELGLSPSSRSRVSTVGAAPARTVNTQHDRLFGTAAK